MSLDSVKNFGFLTVTEHQQLGLIGGYLVLNHLGRPLEFHCTTPVRASRAQKILYGSTLYSFLCGDQVAQLLIQRAKIKPCSVFTDKPQVLAVQEFVDIPVCFIHGNCDKRKHFQLFHDETQVSQEPEKSDFVLSTTEAVQGLSRFRLSEQNIGRYKLLVPDQMTLSASEILDNLKNISYFIDPLEPFERIRLAIEEAQKAA